MESKQYKWEMRSQRFSQWFRSRRLNDKYADFTLRCNSGKEVRCHRFMLAAASPYFDEMFTIGGNYNDGICQLGMVYEDLMDMLAVIYDGTVTVDTERWHSFAYEMRAFKVGDRAIEGAANGHIDVEGENILEDAVEKPAADVNDASNEVCSNGMCGRFLFFIVTDKFVTE